MPQFIGVRWKVGVVKRGIRPVSPRQVVFRPWCLRIETDCEWVWIANGQGVVAAKVNFCSTPTHNVVGRIHTTVVELHDMHELICPLVAVVPKLIDLTWEREERFLNRRQHLFRVISRPTVAGISRASPINS